MTRAKKPEATGLTGQQLIEQGHIKVGDTVEVRFGKTGKQRGVVSEFLLTTDEHPHPPKVLFKDEHGHVRAHNPAACHVVRGAGDAAAETKSESE